MFLKCSVIDVDSYKGVQHKALQVTAQSCSTETKSECNSLTN